MLWFLRIKDRPKQNKSMEKWLTWVPRGTLTHIAWSQGDTSGLVVAWLTEAVIDWHCLKSAVGCLREDISIISGGNFKNMKYCSHYRWYIRVLESMKSIVWFAKSQTIIECDVDKLQNSSTWLSVHLAVWWHSLTLIHGGSSSVWSGTIARTPETGNW